MVCCRLIHVGKIINFTLQKKKNDVTDLPERKTMNCFALPCYNANTNKVYALVVVSRTNRDRSRICFEFYCPYDVTVEHISIPHYRETIESKFISGPHSLVFSLDVKANVCMKYIVKFLYVKTLFWWSLFFQNYDRN